MEVQLDGHADFEAGGHALPRRPRPVDLPGPHQVLGRPIVPPFPPGCEQAFFGMGCFWGAERMFWEDPRVYTTAVGYAGGLTENPTYDEVCTGMTGHAEVVLVVFDRRAVSYRALLTLFWEGHDPTQGMRQGNDIGSQYRSIVLWSSEAQAEQAALSRDAYQSVLSAHGYGPITTEIREACTFHYAEDYHQQYLAKNPWGYCGQGGTGVTCPAGVGNALEEPFRGS